MVLVGLESLDDCNLQIMAMTGDTLPPRLL